MGIMPPNIEAIKDNIAVFRNRVFMNYSVFLTVYLFF
jgi:hypothetical protein